MTGVLSGALDWRSQEGSWQCTGSGTSSTMMFSAPDRTGDYELRYLLDDGYVEVARTAVMVR